MLVRAGFGGSCHWCTEAIFQSIDAVREARQGFIASEPPNDAFSEAVDVTFDQTRISFADLIAVHLATHSSTSNHRLRHKYRSAIYVHDDMQAEEAETAIARLAGETGLAFVTQVLRHRGFKPSDERYQNYYARDPDLPFCQVNIEPKLALLRQRFGHLLRREAAI